MGNDYKLIQAIMDNSEADNWEDAVIEWEIIDWKEDESQSSKCICGKENIKYLFTIRNIYNNIVLEPIGSSCIKKFEREDLNSEVNIHEQSFRLLHAVEDDKYIVFSSNLFSRRLLSWLFDEGAFDVPYNNYDGTSDYEFMLKMFNKRDKESISPAQNRKINAIIGYSIKPYLQKELKNRILY